MQPPYLQLDGPNGRRLVLGNMPITIGRQADNVLVLKDDLTSRYHCVIRATPDGVQVRDLNSSNGTLVNGQPVKSVILMPGDNILVGKTTLILVVPGAAGNQRPGTSNQPRGILDDAPGVESLTDEDIVEDELGEEDVVPLEDEDAPIPLSTSDDEAPPAARAGKNRPRPRGNNNAGDDEDSILRVLQDAAAGVHREPAPPAGPSTPETFDDYRQVLEKLADSLPDKPFDGSAIALINSRGQVIHPANDPAPRGEAVDVFRLVLLVCVRSRATDIHLEPRADHYQLRVRIDGVMIEAARLNLPTGVRVCALVKVLSDIDMTQRDIVQEGHFAATLPDRRVDYRVSFAPTVFGQKLVIRVMDAANAPLRLDNLLLPDWMLQQITASVERNDGMVLVCGPTGSGKTTSLYALIRSCDVAHRNVVTIEDPVEIQIEGANQLPVDEEQNKSFSSLLRSVLRQDPDVIMIGEIRDPETARIAMQAATTGHLVFSTLHTTDTIGTIFRLLDLGVEPYLLAQGLNVVLAQRLVRQLCQYCRKPTRPTPEQIAKLGNPDIKAIYNPAGCPRCLGTGYAGRRAFFELLYTTDELRELITRSPSIKEIRNAVAQTKFVKLAEAGYQLVAQGIASFSEIERAVGR